MTNFGARLVDPNNLVSSAKLRELNTKISDCLTRLYRKPDNGGNPFLFSYSAPKPHILAADKKLAKHIKDTEGREVSATMPVPTAATDGHSYYWHPEFLEKLLMDEVSVVMGHESYHIILFHPERMRFAMKRIANIAFDYVVNALLEKDHVDTHRKGKLWGGNLGKPLLLKDFLDHIDGITDVFKVPTDNGLEVPISKDEARIFVDISLFGRSPESIYDEIMRHWEKSPRKCSECGSLTLNPQTRKPYPPGPCTDRPDCLHGGLCCPGCGRQLNPSCNDGSCNDGIPFPLDSHIDAKMNKQEIQADVVRAAQMTQSMRGTVPGAISEYLGELENPTLKFTDLVRSACLRKAQESGMQNDWKRFRRRLIVANPRQYLPRRHNHKPRWLCMLDTSGSMNDDDLTYAVSQMQVISNGLDGYIVPVDAEPHWDSVTHVKNAVDLRRTKITGRGGTVFDDFFKEFPKKLGMDFDCLIICTDGDFGIIPNNLRPPMDCVWVCTRPVKEVVVPFGRVAPLRHERV
jgi:predicted metal-dependent peptidase